MIFFKQIHDMNEEVLGVLEQNDPQIKLIFVYFSLSCRIFVRMFKKSRSKLKY